MVIGNVSPQAGARHRIGAARRAGRTGDGDGLADVGGAQHLLAFRDDAEQRHREDLEHVLDLEHLAARGAVRVVAGDQEVLLDALALLGLLGLGIEQPDDAVGIAHRRHLRDW